MSKILCVKCEVELRPETNGVKVEEMFMKNKAVYKLWEADLWRCPVCGLQVVSGFGHRPLAEHFQDNFVELLKVMEEGSLVFVDREYHEQA